MCYACYQHSQLAATKLLQSEVAQLKGEIKNLSQELANLKLTTAPQASGEATVSHSFTGNNTNKTTINSNGPTYASILKLADNPANPPTSITPPQPTSNKPPSARLNRNNSVDKNCHNNYMVRVMTVQGLVSTLNKEQGLYQSSSPALVTWPWSSPTGTKYQKLNIPRFSLNTLCQLQKEKPSQHSSRRELLLIYSGIERKLIKICGNSIYINQTKVCAANEDNFVRHQQPLDQSPESIPTNILSANSASNATNVDISPNIPNNVGSSNEVQSQRLQSPERPWSSSPLPTNSNVSHLTYCTDPNFSNHPQIDPIANEVITNYNHTITCCYLNIRKHSFQSSSDYDVICLTDMANRVNL